MKPENILLIIVLLILFIPTNSSIITPSKVYDFLPYVGYSACVAAETPVETKPDVKPEVPDQPQAKCGCGCGRPLSECHCAASGAKGCLPVAAAGKKPAFYVLDFGTAWCQPCVTFKTVDIPILKKSKWIVGDKWVPGIHIVFKDFEKDNVLYQSLIAKLEAKGIDCVGTIPAFIIMKDDEPIAITEHYLNYNDFGNWYNKTVTEIK
jgi:thiol-disulfide isomerase/thioredoxin